MDRNLLKEIKNIMETALKPIIERQGEHSRILDEHSGKLDALLVDVHELQEDAKADKDEFQDLHNLKKEMKEVKEHLELDTN